MINIALYPCIYVDESCKKIIMCLFVIQDIITRDVDSWDGGSMAEHPVNSGDGSADKVGDWLKRQWKMTNRAGVWVPPPPSCGSWGPLRCRAGGRLGSTSSIPTLALHMGEEGGDRKMA
jgi:hypothetical protein